MRSLGELVQSVMPFDLMECSSLWLPAESAFDRPLLLCFVQPSVKYNDQILTPTIASKKS